MGRGLQATKTAGVVSIDGADYDVASGRAVGTAKKASKAPAMPTATQVIDGFIKKSSKTHPAKTKSKIAGAKVVASKRVAKAVRRHGIEPASAMHKRTQHSKTLIRRGLAKPATTMQAATRTLSNPAASLHKMVDPAKLARAKVIPRSDKITRFAKDKSTPAHPKKAASTEIVSRSAQPFGSKASGATMNSLAVSAPHQRLERMLDIALAHADAHKRTRQNKRSWRHLWLGRRWLSLAIALLIILVAATFIAWRDIPTVAIKVADMRAHVPATLPAYTPAGYSYSGPLSYGTEKVTIVYKDKANSGRAYSLSQQKSSWDSTTLLNSINSPKSQVQSSQAGGLTIYTYNGNNSAAWVNNGMLYSIQNKANLSSDQIVNIAQSL